MNQKKRAVVTSAAVVAGMAAIVASAAVLSGAVHVSGAPGLGSSRWMLGLFTISLTATVSAVLLRTTDFLEDSSPDVKTLTCVHCDGQMVDEGRLCPHCGHRNGAVRCDNVAEEPAPSTIVEQVHLTEGP